MNIEGWEQRYRCRGRELEDSAAASTPLVVETARKLRPGYALDLASGTGRNALWLARNGWTVTAVDGASAAIDILRERARDEGLTIDAQVADLKSDAFHIEPQLFDLVAICYYLQRDLFLSAKRGVKRGGTLLAIIHTTQGNEEPTDSRLRPGELQRYFQDWEILHSYEGKPVDPAHQRSVAEIVARRPAETAR